MTQPRLNLMENELGGRLAKRMAGLHHLVAGALPKTLLELVALRASQINGCAPCVDMHTKEAAAAGESQLRLNLVAVWRETGVFTEAERAALQLAEEGTRLADEHVGVSDDTWARAKEHFDDDQLAALVAIVALVNAANRLNVITGVQGGDYDPAMLAAVTN